MSWGRQSNITREEFENLRRGLSIPVMSRKEAKELEDIRRERDQLNLENKLLKAKMARGRFFTPEELKDHDKAVGKKAREEAEQFLKKYAREVAEETNRNTDAYIEERKAIFRDPEVEDLLMNMQCYALHFSVETLVEDFGWQVPPNNNYADMRYKIARYLRGVAERTSKVAQDPDADIVIDAQRSRELYDLGFKVEDEE